jgi:hypothetical protein
MFVMVMMMRLTRPTRLISRCQDLQSRIGSLSDALQQLQSTMAETRLHSRQSTMTRYARASTLS